MIQNKGYLKPKKTLYKKITWFVIVNSFTVLTIWLFYDEPLKPGITEILIKYNTQNTLKNNGEIYRLGMWANFEDDPYEIGLEIVQNSLSNNGYLTEEIYQNTYSQDRWLKDIAADESTSLLLCDFRAQSCLDFIWENSVDINLLLTKYSNYVARYNGLMSYDLFLSATKPSFFEPLKISELDLLSVHLKLLKTIALFRSDRIEEASDELMELIRFNRKQIKFADKIIPKVISTVHYQLSIQVASYLLAKTEISNINDWQSVYDTLQPINEEYLSMRNQYLREIVAFANSVDVFRDNQFETIQTIALKKPLMMVLYKPNKTLNTFYRYMTNGYDTVYYEKGLLQEREIKNSGKDILGIQLNNYVGSMLVSTVSPRYLNIELDLHELNFAQNLYRKIFDARLTGEPVSNLYSLRSPYTGKEAFIQENQLCLEKAEGSNEGLCVYL